MSSIKNNHSLLIYLSIILLFLTPISILPKMNTAMMKFVWLKIQTGFILEDSKKGKGKGLASWWMIKGKYMKAIFIKM